MPRIGFLPVPGMLALHFCCWWKNRLPRVSRKGETNGPVQQKAEPLGFGFLNNLAATYSRGSYTTTTIGKAAFDGRVRNGIGSVHSFMTTKNCLRTVMFSENYTQEVKGRTIFYSRACKSQSLFLVLTNQGKEKAIKPHDRLVLVRYRNYFLYTPSLSTR